MLQRTISRKQRDNPQNRSKYLQIVYLIKNLYRVYIKAKISRDTGLSNVIYTHVPINSEYWG